MSFFTLETPTRISINNPQYVLVESTRDITPTMEGLTIKDAYWGEATETYYFHGMPTENGGNSWWKPAGLVYINIELDGIYHIKAMNPDDWTLYDMFINTSIGDLNFDGRVTISDFIDLASNFGKENAVWYEGDLNLDGSVTISDFIDLAYNLNQPNLPVSPVPEPGSLLLVAFAGSLNRRRRRQ